MPSTGHFFFIFFLDIFFLYQSFLYLHNLLSDPTLFLLKIWMFQFLQSLSLGKEWFFTNPKQAGDICSGIKQHSFCLAHFQADWEEPTYLCSFGYDFIFLYLWIWGENCWDLIFGTKIILASGDWNWELSLLQCTSLH